MQSLKDEKIWMLWRKKEWHGNTAKVPFAANGGKTGMNEEYRHTWVAYQEAEQAATKYPGAGIGFKIPGDVFFLDIDHKDLDDPMVKDILAEFHSYTEYSVSGTGIHIYGKCDFSRLPTYVDEKDNRIKLSKDYYMHHPTNGLELYVGRLTHRYAAYTGNVILDLPLQDCTNAVISVLNRYMKKPEKQKKKEAEDKATQKKAAKLDKQAEKIISKLRNQKNGDRFSRLFDKGEMDGCTDQSKLDIILCAMIAYQTRDDMELLDAVFRKSALYREKWEREDYREETMSKAIECRDDRVERHKSHPFIKVNENGIARVSAPLLAKYAREHLDYLLVRDDGTQAVMKYVYKNGVYTLYDTAMLHGVIKGLIADYDEELVKMSIIKEVVNLLLSDLDYMPQECLNQNEDVINFQNGLLRISGDQTELIPHSPEVLSTIQIPCCWYEETIPTPVFDQYMATLTDGDKEVEQLLLEYMGACISNVQGWRMKKTLFLVGSGNTGKSQLKSLTERLLGKSNFASMDLSEIEARFGTSAIYGKRLAELLLRYTEEHTGSIPVMVKLWSRMSEIILILKKT